MFILQLTGIIKYIYCAEYILSGHVYQSAM